MTSGKMKIEASGHVLLMGFNRPEKRNAMTLDMYHDLARAYGELDRDPQLRCGLLYAVGDHFTGGLDLPEWGSIFSDGQWVPIGDDEIDPFGVDESRRCRKPVVMAAQGICYTIGFELMLASDVRVAARNLRLAQLEVKRAIFPVGGATVRMHQEIGWGNACRYILTGDEMSGEEAYRLGLVQTLVEPGQEFDAAQDIAKRIARVAPLAVQGALASMRRARIKGDEAALTSMFAELAPLMNSKDAAEGLASFLERREAVFTGE